MANDLELYNVRNDGWCLITLALILVGFTNAVPAQGTSKASGALPYAKAVVAATLFHHITTGHWRLGQCVVDAIGGGYAGELAEWTGGEEGGGVYEEGYLELMDVKGLGKEERMDPVGWPT
jgi:hypothetical protein